MHDVTFNFLGLSEPRILGFESVSGEIVDVQASTGPRLHEFQTGGRYKLVIKNTEDKKISAGEDLFPVAPCIGNWISLLYVTDKTHGRGKKILAGLVNLDVKKNVRTQAPIRPTRHIMRFLGIEASTGLFYGFLAGFGVTAMIATGHVGGIILGAFAGGIAYHLTISPSENKAEKKLSNDLSLELASLAQQLRN